MERNWLSKEKKWLCGASAPLSVWILGAVWYPERYHALMHSFKPYEWVTACMPACRNTGIKTALGRVTSLLWLSLWSRLHPVVYGRAGLCIKAQTIICAYSSHLEWLTCGHYFLILSSVFMLALPGALLACQQTMTCQLSPQGSADVLNEVLFFFSSLWFTDLLRLLPPPRDSMAHHSLVIAVCLEKLNEGV